MNPDAIMEFEKVLPMSLAELMAAIRKAKKVVVYVPVADFFMEVPVGKTNLLKALSNRLAEPQWKRCDSFEAEWLDDSTLLVGGERGGEEDADG